MLAQYLPSTLFSTIMGNEASTTAGQYGQDQVSDY